MAKRNASKRMERKTQTPTAAPKRVRTSDPISGSRQRAVVRGLVSKAPAAGSLVNSEDPARSRSQNMAAVSNAINEAAIAQGKAAHVRLRQKHDDAHLAATSKVTSLKTTDATRIGILRKAQSTMIDPIKRGNLPKKRGEVGEGVSPSSWGSLGAKALTGREAHPTNREAKPDRSDTLREAPNCKPKPEPRAGMGNSRHYVPWCDAKKR